MQARITESLLWAATRSLVFHDKISGSEGSPRIRASKRGASSKNRYFAVIGSSTRKRLQIGTDMLLIITSTGDKIFRFINVDDLE